MNYNLDYQVLFGSKGNFEDPKVLKQIDQIFLDKRDYTFKLPKKNSSVILALSGGLDSTGLWYMLLKKYSYNVYPVYFCFGKNIRSGQIKSIRHYSKLFKAKFPKNYQDVFIVKGNKLFSFLNIKNDKNIFYDFPTSLPNLIHDHQAKKDYVSVTNNPARFGHYIFGIYEYALFLKYQKGITVNTILTGFIPENNRVNRESTLTCLRSINLFFCVVLGDYRWQLSGPVEKAKNFYYTKNDLVRFAQDFGLDLSKTFSCDRNSDIHCGNCPSCLSRKIYFK